MSVTLYNFNPTTTHLLNYLILFHARDEVLIRNSCSMIHTKPKQKK